MPEEGPELNLEAAHASAAAKLEAMDAPVSQEPATAPAPAVPPEPQSVPESFYDIDYNGQRHKLSKNDADYLVRFGIQAYESAMRQQAGQGGAPKEEPARTDTNEPWRQEIDPIRAELDSLRAERRIASIVKELDEATNNNEFFSSLKDPEEKKWMRGMALLYQYNNPDASAMSAAEIVAKTMTNFLKSRQTDYVKDKVEQASKRTDTGGTAPAGGPKPLGAKDLFNGKVLQAAMSRWDRLVSK